MEVCGGEDWEELGWHQWKWGGVGGGMRRGEGGVEVGVGLEGG